MTTNNCTKLDEELLTNNNVLPIFYIFTFVVGLILNACGMLCLVNNWKKLRIINIFFLNLGLTNLLFLLTRPFMIVYYFKTAKWTFGEPFCKVTRFCFKLNLYGSIGFITCISVYRYLAIVHPIKVMGKLTVIHVVISVVVWILASVGSLPDVIYPKQSGNNETCLPATDKEHIEEYFDYNLIWTIFGFCIPFIIIAGCYGHVALVISRSKLMNKNQKRKILKPLVILILLFSLCYTPYLVLKNLSVYAKYVGFKKPPCPTWYDEVFTARHVSRGLVSLNSALNPLIYMYFNEDLSAQFSQLQQRCWQMFSCCSKLKSSSEPVPHTDNEVESAL
ncbi:PREDICTED: P2Y purinoceptor 1-like [Poecilia mexicana]|uniref:P2Y purinoceptor 1-like n=1 Tax=Poecilia mexicana TaxID=48701 RepID=UPI00072DC801|nr:PREDICTED: P2Y purinoceptor 1-like [Poecilia mexicana]XP_016516620.1 PREDICTED: P2Y purinoceptor 1-like [Poecilia formosa]